jgi:signal peptidase II
MAADGGRPRGIQAWLWGPWSRLGLAVVAVTLIADQAHKWWMLAVYKIVGKGRVPVLPFLDYEFALNKGISYGLLPLDSRAGQLGLALFAGLASIALWVWIARGATNWVMAAAIGLIIGGALSNAIDRLHLDGVADYIALHAFGFRWYIFNIADAAIVAGVAGLLYESFILSRHAAEKPE